MKVLLFIIAAILLFWVMFALYAVFAMLGAKICRIEKCDFSIAFRASVANFLWMLLFCLALFRFTYSPLVSYPLVLLITTLVYRHYFDTSFGKALGTALIAMIGLSVFHMLIAMSILMAMGITFVPVGG